MIPIAGSIRIRSRAFTSKSKFIPTKDNVIRIICLYVVNQMWILNHRYRGESCTTSSRYRNCWRRCWWRTCTDTGEAGVSDRLWVIIKVIARIIFPRPSRLSVSLCRWCVCKWCCSRWCGRVCNRRSCDFIYSCVGWNYGRSTACDTNTNILFIQVTFEINFWIGMKKLVKGWPTRSLGPTWQSKPIIYVTLGRAQSCSDYQNLLIIPGHLQKWLRLRLRLWAPNLEAESIAESRWLQPLHSVNVWKSCKNGLRYR